MWLRLNPPDKGTSFLVNVDNVFAMIAYEGGTALITSMKGKKPNLETVVFEDLRQLAKVTNSTGMWITLRPWLKGGEDLFAKAETVLFNIGNVVSIKAAAGAADGHSVVQARAPEMVDLITFEVKEKLDELVKFIKVTPTPHL